MSIVRILITVLTAE